MANITINPFGTGGELPTNIGIVNDLITGGADKALSAEQGKLLGNAAKTGMYMADGEDGSADEEITFQASDFVTPGVRLATNASGIATLYTANASDRATFATIIYYCGEGTPPSGTVAFDLSRFKSFTVPTGYDGSPTFQAALSQGATAKYPSGWTSGTYTFTDSNKSDVANLPYMIFNFKKTNGGNLSSTDLTNIAAGFKITMEGEAIEPVFTQHKAVSVVDEEGDEVFAMSSPSATEGGETEIYSKDAVDELLAEFSPESEDVNYRLPKAGVETDDVEVKTFPSSDIVSGVRIVYSWGGVSQVTTNTQRATVNKVYYCGEGDAPSGTEKFDLSKLKSFTSPSGFKASPTFAAALEQNAAAVYPTGWQSGTYTFTDANRAAAEGKPYMVWNFTKGSGSETIGSSDLVAIAAGFKIVCESAATDPADAAIDIVGEDGNSVKQVFNGGDRNTVEIYSKDAVDALLGNVTPNPFDSSKARRNLRVAHWNVGNFSLGSHMPNVIFNTDGDNVQKAFTNKVRQIGADVFMMCEWYTSARSAAIFSDYPYSDTTVGSGNTRVYAIKSNFKLDSVDVVNFGVNNLPNETFKVATITIGKWTIALIECHLYYSGVYANDQPYRAAEMQAILDYVSTQGYDKVIIGGDFNNGHPNDTNDDGPHELDVFKTAGYKMFNFDLYERVNTYPATGRTDANHTTGFPSSAIDNIMCKGCSIVAGEVIDDGTLTDHCCVVCDIVLDDLTE